ncbi:Oxysterol-binding protein-related protein 9 [Lamellibrachia satsuma]|nr:Oxysterol-binding protein-related protein 9 [Lamellibrachia satsuma]
MEGPLSKWTNVVRGWQYRWFVLDDDVGLLSYYTSKEKMSRGVRRGCVRLKGATIGIDDEDDSTFTITVDQKMFHFQARDADERERWIHNLEQTILRHTSTGMRATLSYHSKKNEFERKLAETDVYLQVLIKQVESLEGRIALCVDERTRMKCIQIKDAAETMIDSIKQGIVLLQITKHLVNEPYIPKSRSRVNVADTGSLVIPFGSITSRISFDSYVGGKSTGTGVTSESTQLSQSSEDIQQKQTDDSDGDLATSDSQQLSTSLPNLNSPQVSAVLATVELDKAGSSQSDTNMGNDMVRLSMKASRKSAKSPRKENESMPTVSYSSSEEEDDFFDASETVSKMKTCESSGSPKTKTKAKAPPVVAGKDVYFDELYDCQDDEDLEINAHSSIITHLLSQVRIGMDLTKIVLPTFILERRSLLEMFADFLAHPDLFVGIADQKTPRDRMVQLVRWYLSAFHAGRRSQVAKKPYNPIIGETFRCSYDLPEMSDKKDEKINGPLPWSTENCVSFIAEQVSHHPPISAFYAEHFKKHISIDGYVWTKSKFLGLSVGVYMVGQSVVSVEDYGEEYIIMFPSAYGRSILTVPWIELGGKIELSCAKSGYHATVEFLTKPFYGGKKNQVVAEIFAPKQKKSFCTIKGEWNGQMTAKFEDNPKNELFLDTKTMPVVKKKVLPIADQDEFESRRLWKEVTQCLKDKNVGEATKFKQGLEARQRAEEKERKEQKLKWQTKCFNEEGEHWVYHAPLVKRLNLS